jgi:4-diphosphocytidyl-2-C-methyl-D-erythritol kinase
VAGKRPDGYHNLETIFYPIPLKEALELTINTGRKDHTEPFGLTITGTEIPGSTENNICTKAWQVIKNDFPQIPPVRMHLLKAIPIGAGLGGGSADGAFTLMLLNQELHLNLTNEQLAAYALTLGSDCPFFILNQPCYATGRGEILEPVNVDLSDYYFVVVFPNIHISTAEVFKDHAKTKSDPADLKSIINQPVDQWKDHLVNEFEVPVFVKHPAIKQIKQQLYEAGAVYASMSGTGSSVFGIFHNSKKTANLLSGENHKVFILNHAH